MATNFSRTLRSLDADRPRGRIVVLVLLVLAAWGAWLGLAVVPVYEVTPTARLEVSRAAHPVAATVAGRVIRSQLQLGRQVAEGEVLVELDGADSELAVREKQTKVSALDARRTAIASEIAAERETLAAQKQARSKSSEELTAQITKAESLAKFTAAQADRARKLRDSKTITEADAEKTISDAETAQFALVEAQAAIKRSEQDRVALESERQTRIVRLERESIELRGEMDIERAAIKRLERDLSERQVHAPVAGRIGEVQEVRVGSVVQAAQKLCSIVPTGSPRAVAQFSPVVVGRLRAGQSARLRLDGFPWTQFGTLDARVSDIDTEPRDGFVRVELALSPKPTSKIPLDHGLTGSVEIEVERVTPLVLVLRAAGQFLGTRRAKSPEMKSQGANPNVQGMTKSQ